MVPDRLRGIAEHLGGKYEIAVGIVYHLGDRVPPECVGTADTAPADRDPDLVAQPVEELVDHVVCDAAVPAFCREQVRAVRVVSFINFLQPFQKLPFQVSNRVETVFPIFGVIADIFGIGPFFLHADLFLVDIDDSPDKIDILPPQGRDLTAPHARQHLEFQGKGGNVRRAGLLRVTFLYSYVFQIFGNGIHFCPPPEFNVTTVGFFVTQQFVAACA